MRHMSTSHRVTADFRNDPLFVDLLREIVVGVANGLPDMEDSIFQELLFRYRKAAGERTGDSVYSFAKAQFDAHISQFRALYPDVLNHYLMSQMDRAQGREAAWPLLDGEAPDLVTDAVMERRIAIDNLTKLIDVEADEGVRVFDALLAEALGCEFKTLRDNPLRPAVFFHALGLSWTKASESDRDELFVLSTYARCIGPRVAAMYPVMTKVLRQALNRPKPGSLNVLAAGAGGNLYERLKGSGAAAAAAVLPQEEATIQDRRVPNRSAGDVLSAAMLSALDSLDKRLEPAMLDAATPAPVALMLARIHAASVRRFLIDPGLLASREHPLWKLLKDLGDVAGWRAPQSGQTPLEPLLMHLSVIRELLARERSARAPDSSQDARLFDHLRAQFLALRSAPPPKFETAQDVSLKDAARRQPA
jgi:hypothetical protein